MTRRKLISVLLRIGPVSVACLPALGQGRGNGKGRGRGKENEEGKQGNSRGESAGTSYFRREDYTVIQRYYAGPRDLPPGLRKKYARTGTLPPGWEKKIRPFPAELVRTLPPPPPNCDRGFIDGVAVVYDRKTRVILDSIDLIAAIARH